MRLLCVSGLLLAVANVAQAQPTAFDECTPVAFLYQGAPTTAFGVDLVTGEFENLANNFYGQNINAIGYNILDDFIYGWDSDEIVRVGSNYQVVGLGEPVDPGPDTYDAGRSFIGDIDENGHFWFIADGRWFQVDLAPGSATYMEILSQGPVAGGGIEGFGSGADWAYVPGAGNFLFRPMRDTITGNAVLFRFDRADGSWTNLGDLGPIGNSTIGAVYVDAAGFLYASDNTTGEIHRINVQNATAEFFAQGPSASTNDGARCFAAEVLADFGDAPDSYGTTLAANGPRHGLPGYDAATNTAPLMLGTRVGPDADGQPSVGANADAFDDALVGIPRYRQGQETDITVTVTNNTDEVATLVGWMDVGGTETFNDDLAVSLPIPANSGTATYDLTFPTVTIADESDTYLRLRLYPGTVNDPSPTGVTSASAGEVEDHLVRMFRRPVGVPLDTPWMLILLTGLLALAGGRLSRRRRR